MTSPTLAFKILKKDRNWYNQYEFSLRFKLTELLCLPEVSGDAALDYAEIARSLERRRNWRSHIFNVIQNVNWTQGPQQPDPQHGEDLRDFRDALANYLTEYKLLKFGDWGYIYTNQYKLLEQLDQLRGLQLKEFWRCEIDRPVGTIRRVNPKGTHRAYLKWEQLSVAQKASLVTFFETNADSLSISDSLRDFLFKDHLTYCRDYFFFDYSHSGLRYMIDLIHPGLIRRTLEILPAK